ncbi:TetR/AcrR family transcriptional regulator [Reyranella sp.]|uniref:TetR/AcrR family transcriptional regulator n=1 Tax=Reyranella sp. TaxID=1929291 RepID=UPI003BAAD881
MTGTTDIRATILAAALAIVRKQGLGALTQPRVAKASGVSQSHLTYYFPTRADLVRAVLEAAVAGQIANLGSAMASRDSQEARLAGLAAALSNAENTRILVSIVLAADADPAYRELYNRLVTAMRQRAELMLRTGGLEPTAEQVMLLHALGTGLAVMGAALGPQTGRAVSTTVLRELFRLLARDAGQRTPPDETT